MLAFVCLIVLFQFTVVTRCGAAGHRAAGRAQEELSVALVPAQIPLQQMEEETVMDKALLQNLENVINTTAQVNILQNNSVDMQND